jgi:transcription antitermination factor NusG
MANLEKYRDRFAESGWQIFVRAIAGARTRGRNLVGVEHVLYALADERAELFTSLLRSVADNRDAFAMLVELIEQRLAASPKHEGASVRLSVETIELFKRTLKRVRANARQRIEAVDLFITLVMDEKSLLRELLAELLADPDTKSLHVRDLIAVVESASASRRPASQRTYKFLAGEMVRIKNGPFANFKGTIADVNEEAATLQIAIFIMGREQPVELKFFDVEKLRSE